MNLLKMNLWRGGFFKQVKFLVASPQQAQGVILISETGTVSHEMLPLSTGFVCANTVKKAWAVLHSLKYQVRKDNTSTQDNTVLVISERSYIPLDPLDTIKPKDKEKMAALKDIARLRHAEVRATAGTSRESEKSLTGLIINGSFVILAIYGMVTLLQGCGQ